MLLDVLTEYVFGVLQLGLRGLPLIAKAEKLMLRANTDALAEPLLHGCKGCTRILVFFL